MVFEQIEHPDVTAACRTGYPVRYISDPTEECYHCGRGVYDVEFDDDGRIICDECLEKGEDDE